MNLRAVVLVVPAKVEEPELGYPSSVPLVTGPSSGHLTSVG